MGGKFRSGYICLVGRPNVGKSTLLNRLVGRPISITAPKPQTTRNRVLGIRHEPGHQAIFVDTPGIHDAHDALNRRMVKYALSAMNDADVVFLIVEPLRESERSPNDADRRVLDYVARVSSPKLLLINKIDLVEEARIPHSIARFNAAASFDEIVPISALKGRGIERLESLIPGYLSEGPAFFETDWHTDQSEATFIAEMVRQEVFRRTHREVPYSTAVKVEHMEETPSKLTVYAKIYVEWDSQKGILIGKGGSMLKSIGTAARLKLEKILGVHVYLSLQVSVLKDWSTNPRRLEELGYPDT